MFKGFKEFILRGSLIEVAVAFIVASAVSTMVQAFVDVILSCISRFGGQPDFSEVAVAGVKVGPFINSVVSFVLITAVVYFCIIGPYNKLKARRARGQEPAPPADDVALLMEIRDLLAREDSRRP
jgi:large conductance mechanosensitive channel